MKPRTIAKARKAMPRQQEYDFSVDNVSSQSMGIDIEIDPILNIDHFLIRKPKFPPHPHAGFSAVTYLFEDTEGEFINRDSAGNYHVAQPGSIVWNVTGSGVVHEEFPKVKGQLAHGLQMFVNLSAENKLKSPQAFFVNGADVPVYKNDIVTARIMVGELNGIKAKINPPGHISFFDIKLKANSSFEFDIPIFRNVLIYVITGKVTIGDKPKVMGSKMAILLKNDSEKIQISTNGQEAQFVVVAGTKLREPVVSYGSFVMNTEEQIKEAYDRYHSGAMGVLKAEGEYEK